MDQDLKYIFISKSSEETKRVAERLAGFLFPGAVITLDGPLGSGKTTFVGGVAKGLDILERVISPTFNIMKCYFEARLPMFHIDAYRLENRDSELGLEEFIEGDGVTLIEWPDYIKPLIPASHLRIVIKALDENSRRITFENIGSAYEQVIKSLKDSYQAWQRQSELMAVEVDAILKRNNISAKDIGEVVVTIGPGSYTGIRIALTIAKTLAFALDIKIYAVSSLISQKGRHQPTISVINARSNRSYVAIYDADGQVLVEEKVWPNDELIAWIKGNADFIVSGDAKYLGIDAYQPSVLDGMLEAKKKSIPVENILTLKPVYLKDLL